MASEYLWLPNVGASVAVTDVRDDPSGGSAVDQVNERLIKGHEVTVAKKLGSEDPVLVINWAALSRYEVMYGDTDNGWVLHVTLTNDGFGRFDVSDRRRGNGDA